jgi:hypothetical protein
MSVCAEVQSARPIARALEIPTPVSARGKPVTGGRFLWMWIDSMALSNAFVVPVGMGARPFATARFVSDDPTDSVEWFSYEYPWLPVQAEGFFSGEIQWPEPDLEY